MWCYDSAMHEKRDIELAYQFPAHISIKSRARIARLGVLFMVAQVLIFLFLVFV